jgi:hypothetical protein
MTTRALAAARALTLCALLALAGCSHHATGTLPSDDSQAGASRLLGPTEGDKPFDWPSGDGSAFGLQGQGPSQYPLAVSNRWDYSIRLRTTIIDDHGAQPPVVTEHPWVAEIIGTRDLGTRTYYIQAESDPRVAAAAPSLTFLLRGDRSGLYSTDAISTEGGSARAALNTAALLRQSVGQVLTDESQHPAFERAAIALATKLDAMRDDMLAYQPRPGGADPGETTQLRYPLHMSARWIVRDSPRFVRTVVGRERLRLPAGDFTAWKLRGTSELFGPGDRVHFWYARAGLVRLTLRAEVDVVDDANTVIGRMIVEQDQVLESLHLHQPGGPVTMGR